MTENTLVKELQAHLQGKPACCFLQLQQGGLFYLAITNLFSYSGLNLPGKPESR